MCYIFVTLSFTIFTASDKILHTLHNLTSSYATSHNTRGTLVARLAIVLGHTRCSGVFSATTWSTLVAPVIHLLLFGALMLLWRSTAYDCCYPSFHVRPMFAKHSTRLTHERHVE